MPLPTDHGHDLIVMGASMDGIAAFIAIVASLPADLPAAVCIVQHASPDSPGYLAAILDGVGPLPATLAEDGEPLECGRLYVAPPDRHLLVQGHRLHLGRGPRENRTRPAIDPLFRTAAVAYRSRVIGVVLTGLLDDGAAGLHAVKRCGGLAVVQSPEDASFPSMPRAALDTVAADHVVPLAEMGALLGRLAGTPAPSPPPIPDDLLLEVRLTERVMDLRDASEGAQHLGEPVLDMCPECGGPLRQLPGAGPPGSGATSATPTPRRRSLPSRAGLWSGPCGRRSGSLRNASGCSPAWPAPSATRAATAPRPTSTRAPRRSRYTCRPCGRFSSTYADRRSCQVRSQGEGAPKRGHG